MDETSVSGLMALATRQQELETVVSWLAELHEQVPASLQHDLSAMARVVELALPSLLHFAHLLEDRHQQAVQALGGEAVHLIAWAWQRRTILGPQMHTLLQGLAPAWRSTAHLLLESWTQALRASSVVENWHSIVRPHLAVHRTRIAQACWRCWPFGTIIALRLVVLMRICLLYNAVKLLRSKPIGLPPLAIFLPLLDCSICHMDLNLA